MCAKKEKIYHTYVSKHNPNREKQVILLMIPNGEKRKAKSKGRWHCLAVNKLSALLRGIISKNNGYLYCLDHLHSFRTKNKLELQKNVCENKDFHNVITPFFLYKHNEYKHIEAEIS